MRAYTQTPPPDDETPDFGELLLADADDDLVPFAATGEQHMVSVEAIDTDAMGPVAMPRWTAAERIAYRDLARFVDAAEPRLGWRRVLFVVSGIQLSPARGERVLREAVGLLLESVDPLILDSEKEAAS
jgi:hypothetical protein